MTKNYLKLQFYSLARNQGFARDAVAAFCLELNPTLSDLSDVKTAVSEAVTNAIIHGYPDGVHTVVVRAVLHEETVELWITDEGVGMEDVKQAMEPLYTSRPELERSGMGFMFMEAFMDQVEVQSSPGVGTTVYMKKRIKQDAAGQED